MSVAGSMIVGDRRPFVTQILPNPTVPDLSVVTGVYLYVLHGNGTTAQWNCTVISKTALQILASYAPVAGDNDVAGELIHLLPFLVIPTQPDTPCATGGAGSGYEVQVRSK